MKKYVISAFIVVAFIFIMIFFDFFVALTFIEKETVSKNLRGNTSKLISLIENEKYNEAKAYLQKNKIDFTDEDKKKINDLLSNSSNPFATQFYFFILEKQNKNLNITSITTIKDEKTGENITTYTAENQSTWSDIMVALKEQNSVKVDELLNKGVDVKATTNNGSTALIVASKYADAKVLKRLISLGSNVNHLNNFGYSALMVAIRYDKYENAKILLDAGAKVELENAEWLALELEMAKGHKNYEFIESLLEQKPLDKYNEKYIEGFLNTAIFTCNVEMLKFLVNHLKNSIWQYGIDEKIEVVKKRARDKNKKDAMLKYLSTIKK